MPTSRRKDSKTMRYQNIKTLSHQDIKASNIGKLGENVRVRKLLRVMIKLNRHLCIKGKFDQGPVVD